MVSIQKILLVTGMLLTVALGKAQETPDSLSLPDELETLIEEATPSIQQAEGDDEGGALASTEEENRSVADIAAKTTLVTGQKIFLSLLLLLVAWLVVRLFKRALETFSERSTKHRITIKGLIPVATILLWSLASYIIIVAVFAPPRETLFAGMASLGLALGFAAQDILKNIFAGIIILFDSPFRVGDKIEVGSHYGEVIAIGLRSTKIITPDDSMVTIPNNDAMNTAVSNSNTGEAFCQVVAELYLPPHLDTVAVRKLAIEAAQVSKYIYLNKPIAVLFFNEIHHGVPFYKMRLKAYVMDIRSEFAFKSDMTELVMQQLFKEGLLDKEYYMNHSSSPRN